MKHHRNALAASALALPMAFGAWPAHAADIVETLRESGQFSVLVRAIEEADLTETLSGEGPFTVFAPTDRAFHQLPLGVFRGLLEGENRDDLRTLLQHHIVEGEELAAQDLLGEEAQVTSLQGDSLTVDGTGAVVLLVPTGLSVTRIGDEVFVERQVAAVARPAITVTAAGEEQAATARQQQAQQQEQAQQRPGQQQAQQPQQQQQQQPQQQQQQQPQQQQAQQAQQAQQQEQQQPTLARPGETGERVQQAMPGMAQQRGATAEGPAAQYSELQRVSERELKQALRAAQAALQQQDDWRVQLALEQADIALAQSELDQRREVSRLLDEAERAVEADNWEDAREALRQLRRIAPREQAQQLRRPLEEARMAMGQRDWQRAGDSLRQAEQALAGAEQRRMAGQPQQTAAAEESQRERTPLGAQRGLFRAATVVQPDIEADNGVIHAISEVVVPQGMEQQLTAMLDDPRERDEAAARQAEEQREQPQRQPDQDEEDDEGEQ